MNNGAGEKPLARILVADDDAPFRESHAGLLRKRGFECVTAPSADEALALLTASPFDLLLSDLYMPGKDGFHLIECASAACPGLPIILFTGLPSIQSAAKCVQLPVAAYIEKPPDMDELANIIVKAVARYRQYQVVTASRMHLDKWTAALRALEAELGGNAEAPANSDGAADYLRLTFLNLTRQMAQLSRLPWSGSSAPDAKHSADKLQLVSALEQTIEVLENTRRSFKSSELGNLRRHLATVLEHCQEQDSPDGAGSK